MFQHRCMSGAVMLALTGLAGCLGDRESGAPESASPDGPAELVATVQLTNTHVVQFWDYGHGDAMIDERLNVDLDREAPLRVADIGIQGKTLVDVYVALGGERGDATTMQRLTELDAPVTARARATVVTPEIEERMQA